MINGMIIYIGSFYSQIHLPPHRILFSKYIGVFIWSSAKVIYTGKNNTELVLDSRPTWFWGKIPLLMQKKLELKSMIPMQIYYYWLEYFQ